MFRYLILVLSLTSMTVHAETSLRINNKVLTVGDSAARILQLMGEPTIRAFASTQTGGLPANQLASGEHWQYSQNGKTVIVTIIGGRVANFETLYQP